MPQVGAFLAGAVGLGAPAIGTAAFGAYVAGVSAAGFLTSSVVGKLLTSVALSALARALTPTPRQPGITTSSTLTGGATPESYILGRYATEGQLTCPPMSHGADGKTPNAYLTYVIELGGIPGQTLQRVIIDGDPVTLGGTAHPDYGAPVEGRFAGFAWVKYYDGTQTAADPMLLDRYGTAAERPWLSDMVGEGICYAICTFRFSRTVWSGFPKVRFEMQGIPLYDPRKDSTVGGSGSHRFGSPATWEPTDNPMVMAYALCRGIPVQGEVYGGGFAAADLPLAEWFAAMNACDAAVDIGDSETEPAYRAGIEVYVNEEPARYLDELLKSCAGLMWESGGVWKARAGAPGLPVFSFADADLIVDDSDDLDPHPAVEQIANAVAASYPDPASLWEPRDAPVMEDAALIALDGGRRLVSDLTFNAVPYPLQVQRLALAYLRDSRRFRRHELTLPAAASVLEPGDVVAWTSARHGYTAQEFEVARVADPFISSRVRLALREVDPADWDADPGDLVPVTPPDVTPVDPGALAVPGWTVSAVEIGPGRVGILIGWDGDGLDGVRALSWEVRLAATSAFVSRGQVLAVSSGQALIAEGLLPDTDYEVRGVFVASFPVTPTAWTPVSTPVSLITPESLADVPALIIRGRKEVTAGPEQNLTPAEARTVLQLGTAALATVTSSAADQTANRVLRVGAGPLQLAGGRSLRAVVGGTANAITLTTGAGFASVPAGFEVRFRAAASNTGAATLALDGLAAAACVTVTGAALPAGYIRTDVDTVALWDGTNWVLDRQVQRGSTANGRFVRHADGSQICWHTISAGSGIAAGAGTAASPYATTAFGWTFPAAFSEAPVVGGSAGFNGATLANRIFALTIRSVSASAATDMNAVRLSSSAVDVSVTAYVTATGWWY